MNDSPDQVFQTWDLVLQALTLVVISIAAWQLVVHSRQMHRDFETIYVTRYWQIMDRRSAKWVLRQKFSRADDIVALAYLQLCEDEIDLRRLGRVTDNTWAFWSEAIGAQVKQEPYRTALERFGRDEFPLVDSQIKAASDPLKRRWLWRKFHGL